MAQIQTTKADLVRAIETERDWWTAIIDSAESTGPLTGNEPIDGDWTFKELLSHIDGWRRFTVARFQAAADGSDQPATPWPSGMSDQTEAGTDEINAWFKKQSQSQTLDTVVQDLMGTLDSMTTVVEQMSAEDLLTPGRFPWLSPGQEAPTIGPTLIDYSVSHVRDEHAPALIAWVSNRLGQQVELPPQPENFGCAL